MLNANGSKCYSGDLIQKLIDKLTFVTVISNPFKVAFSNDRNSLRFHKDECHMNLWLKQTWRGQCRWYCIIAKQEQLNASIMCYYDNTCKDQLPNDHNSSCITTNMFHSETCLFHSGSHCIQNSNGRYRGHPLQFHYSDKFHRYMDVVCMVLWIS